MTTPSNPSIYTLNSIQKTHDRIRDLITRTPILTSETIDKDDQCKYFFKAENFQKTGSFKFRGASSAISEILTRDSSKRPRGIITYSSGNHGQAIARAAQFANLPVTVVMPSSAPLPKRKATRSYGARVVEYDPVKTVREELGEEIAERDNLELIPPYNHPHVILGQGTLTLEMLNETTLDYFFAPVGGGGLISGNAIAIKNLSPKTKVIGVEPVNANDAKQSFYTREIVKIQNPDTIADGVRTPCLGSLTFPLILEYVDELIDVSEREIVEAMFYLWERLKVIVEPTGAVAYAGARKMAECKGKRVGIVLCGGNVDPAEAVEKSKKIL